MGRLAAHPNIVGMKDSASSGIEAFLRFQRPAFHGPGGLGQLPLPGHDGRLARRHRVAGQLLPGGRARLFAYGELAMRPTAPASRTGQPHQRGHLRHPRGVRREGGHGPGRLPRRHPAAAPAAARAAQARRSGRCSRRRVSCRERRHPRHRRRDQRAQARCLRPGPRAALVARRTYAITHLRSGQGGHRARDLVGGAPRCCAEVAAASPTSASCPFRHDARPHAHGRRRYGAGACGPVPRRPLARPGGRHPRARWRGRFLAETCNLPVSGGSSLASILWFRDNDPDVWAARPCSATATPISSSG